MPNIDPYLFFGGNCAEAMQFYEKTLGGRIKTMMTHAQSPMAAQAAPEMKHLIMHAALELDGRTIMASDAMPGKYEGMKNVAIALSYPTADEARKIHKLLAEDGEVQMPMEKTFWAEAFGAVKDRFGTSWFVGGGMLPLPG